MLPKLWKAWICLKPAFINKVALCEAEAVAEAITTIISVVFWGDYKESGL